MTKRHLTHLGLSLSVLGFLFMIRMLFFYETNGIGSKVLFWITWFGSWGVLAYPFLVMHAQTLTWLKAHKDVLVLGGVLIILDLFLVISQGIPMRALYPMGLLLTVYLITWVYKALRPRASLFWAFGMIVLFALYVILQSFYVPIFNELFSFKEIVTLREGAESSEGMYRIQWVHVATVIVTLVGGYFLIKFRPSDQTPAGVKKRWLLYPLLVLLVMQFGITYPVQPSQVMASDHLIYARVPNRIRFASSFSPLHLMFRDLGDAMVPNITLNGTREDLDEYFSDLEPELLPSSFDDMFEGKNLIFILAESYDEMALSQSLTPHLYKLKHEGISFDHHYTPVFQRTTSDTEFIFNTSLIPSIEDGPTGHMFRENSYRTALGYLFTQKGYQTSAFHGNYASFYNRDLVYAGYGYQTFYGQHELNLADDDKKFDTRFYNQTKDVLLEQSSPFMSFLISFSGHSPYTKNHPVASQHIETVEAYYGSSMPESAKYYIATQVELDQMIGMLIDDLETRMMLDDTVIILTGDHYPYTMIQKDYETVTGYDTYYLKNQGNLYIWHQGITPLSIQHLSSSFDVLPIINALFGLDGDTRFYVGKNSLVEPTEFIYFKNYMVYDSVRLVSLFDPFMSMTDQISDRAFMAYDLSKKILRTNYLKP